MSRPVFHVHHEFLFLLLLAVTAVIAIVAVELVGRAFGNLGFGWLEVGFLLAASLVGSTINIPVLQLKSRHPITQPTDVSVFGITFRIPQVASGVTTTQIAVNLGGALIPTLVSIYLLWMNPSVLASAIAGIAIVTLVIHVVARPVAGVGIVTPFLVPPLAAALCGILLPSTQNFVVAYTSGVLGTLIGADLTNLNKISELGAPMASIGGAGTFDGVFLSGIIAVLLT